MADNVIDTLKLDIIVNTKQNGQSITTLRNSLEKLYKFLNGVNNQDFSKVSNDIAKIGGRLTPLVNAINALDGQGLKNLTSLGTRLQTLNKRMGEIDAKAMAHKFDLMTQSITPFINKVMSAQESLVALNNVMGGAKTLTKTTTTKGSATSSGGGGGSAKSGALSGFAKGGWIGAIIGAAKSISITSIINKLYFVKNITKQLGQELAKVVQYGIDYEETLNLWQVAMKGNTAEARRFVREIEQAYGISEAVTMQYQATFKNMLSALGNINQEVAYGLSETLTQMALDYASLYNVSIESAMTKFQAVLAGQVRPIRNESGYDVTEQTLYQLYQDIGGTKTVRQLNQVEKRLLRILAVYRQMQDTAKGDLSNTIRSTANQLRVMQQQGRQFATWMGVSANQLVQNSGILIEINGYLYAAAALARQFAYSMGYVEKSEENAKEPLPDMEEDWNSINKQVDDYKGKLLGFDKFQVLSSAGVDEESVDIAKELQKAMDEYDAIINSAENPAFKRSLELLQAWGLELDENGKIVGGFDNVKEKVTDIAKSLGGILFLAGMLINPIVTLPIAIEACILSSEELRDELKSVGANILPSIEEAFSAFEPVLDTIFVAVVDIIDEFMPLVPIVTDIIKNLAPTFVGVLQIIVPILSTIFHIVLQLLQPILKIVEIITWGMQRLNPLIVGVSQWVTVFLLAPLEAIFKVLASIYEIAHTILSLDFNNLGQHFENLADLWSDWGIASPAVSGWQNIVEGFNNVFVDTESAPSTAPAYSDIRSDLKFELSAFKQDIITSLFGAKEDVEFTPSETAIYVDGQKLFDVFVGTASRNGYKLVER